MCSYGLQLLLSGEGCCQPASLPSGSPGCPPPPHPPCHRYLQNATVDFILNEGKPLKVKLVERLQQLGRVLRDRQQDSR
jgi:hypothetical protein